MPNFKQSIKKDLKNLLKRDRLIVFVDKSRNMYSTSAKYCKKLMNSYLSTTYKNSDDDIVEKINNESQETISSKYFNIKNKRVPKFFKVNAFLTVKGHKKRLSDQY